MEMIYDLFQSLVSIFFFKELFFFGIDGSIKNL